ncbi:uncharacterized protein LOC121725481 [Aricia agestis]|uniref:uncharacterized protein LOC121725481 n=1 Tax=Aricia agestis TaxID=91739 RepID=UPI001C201DE9|nr:uncharacterized protein LOC121725481 [Aricia agestis]
MLYNVAAFLLLTVFVQSEDQSAGIDFNYLSLKDDIYDEQAQFMSLKNPHEKASVEKTTTEDPWVPFDFSKFDAYLTKTQDGADNNRIKRHAKNTGNFDSLVGPKIRERPDHYLYPVPIKDRKFDFFTTSTTRKPPIMPESMNPGVVFRVRMADAILRIKQRMYEDPERHIESDIIYTNLIKKVVTDEITKFHNLLLMYKTDRSIKEHLGECGGRIYKFISYMTIKVHIYCLFDALWIDGNPYVIGDEYSVTPVEVPPMLQCDAAECNSVIFVDSISVPKDFDRHHIHGRRRSKLRSGVASDALKNITTANVPVASKDATRRKNRKDTYDTESNTSSFVEMPKDLYQAHLRPGVIFRIHMSEAILKMQYRNYAEDKDESVIEADVEYLRLTRKVISDEITKFEDLNWLMGWFQNRSDLIHEHTCNTRYYTVGVPPTKFSGPEEYMKRACLFDSVYVDQMPYVVGEDGSLLAAVAPPVLHCDAATCTSVPFIDSLMFEEQYGLTNVRTITRCQASCRSHCKNDADCLKRCSDRCLRTE